MHSILVVEDDDDILQSLAFAFGEEGYAVTIARNGVEAIAALARMPEPSVILLDLVMPRMNGWELLAWLEADRRLAEVPVIVFSASDDAQIGPTSRPVIRKPADPVLLLQLVREMCKQEDRFREDTTEAPSNLMPRPRFG